MPCSLSGVSAAEPGPEHLLGERERAAISHLPARGPCEQGLRGSEFRFQILRLTCGPDPTSSGGGAEVPSGGVWPPEGLSCSRKALRRSPVQSLSTPAVTQNTSVSSGPRR